MCTAYRRKLGDFYGPAGAANRDLLARADIVRAEDPATGESATVYGADLIEDVVGGRAREFSRKVSVEVSMSLAEEGEDLVYLYVLIEVLKGPGSCGYGP
jgi:hypothetical protein